MNTIALNWERHLASTKESQKKYKFKSLEPFIKQIILNTSSVSGQSLAVDSSPHIKGLINYSSIARAQLSLNYLLQKQNMYIKVLLPFITTLMNSDWVGRGSSGLSKISFLLLSSLGVDSKPSSSKKASLTL